MANLRTVVNALLTEVIVAQHSANRLTRRLAAKYQADALLQHMPIPNATVDEVELTLHFAVGSVGVEAQGLLAEADAHEFSPSAAALNRLADPIARWISEGLAAVIRRAQSEEHPLRERLLAALSLGGHADGLAAHIAGALAGVLAGESTASAAAAGRLVEASIAAIRERVTAALGADDDLKAVVGSVEEAVAEAISYRRDRIEEAISRLVERPSDPGIMGDGAPAVEVILDSSTLSQLPAAAIQTARIRLSARAFRSVPDETSQLIPEDR